MRRQRHDVLQGYALTIVGFVLVMTLYISVWGADNRGSLPVVVQDGQTRIAQALSPAKGSVDSVVATNNNGHMILSPALVYSKQQYWPEVPVPETNAVPAHSRQRMVAPRERGQTYHIWQEVHEEQNVFFFMAIVGSVLWGAVMGKQAVDRWIARDEKERHAARGDHDEYHIVFSRTTNEIGYGSCRQSDWTSDITKFDV